VPSRVSLGLGRDVINVESRESVDEYRRFLNRNFPDCEAEVDEIIRQVKLIMGHMDVLYGVENPAFFDLKEDKEYVRKTLLPWIFKFLLTVRKIARLNLPVDEFLGRLIANQPLIDFVIQHFFKKMPTFFAMSYFSLYLDYIYPFGGTGVLAEKLRSYFESHGGSVVLGTEITGIDPSKRTVSDMQGTSYSYGKLLWAANTKKMYDVVDIEGISDRKAKRLTLHHKTLIADKIGGDSVYTLYLGVDLDPEYFKGISHGHFFYTPLNTGLSEADKTGVNRLLAEPREVVTANRKRAIDIVRKWLKTFFALNTFEISIPVLRDQAMAPPGETGLIISTLFDYEIVKLAEDLHWYDEFKQQCEEIVINILTGSIYPEIKGRIVHKFSSTPMTLGRMSGNSDGAITGWAFSNKPVPAVHRQLKFTKSVLTPIPDVYQAGQWTFSPSGLPIAILTGKLAADRIIKSLK
jgi:phytoene dehydrogenase-like protein